MPDYPLANTQVIWNPDEGADLPPVKLVIIPGDDDNRYISSWGACNADFRNASEKAKVGLLMKQFIHLAINENVPAKDIHETFMHIPEYRQALADFGAIDPNLV